MSEQRYPGLEITQYWANLNDELIKLAGAVPEDKINYSPKPELWNFRGIMLHIAAARDGWLGHTIRDGVDAPDVWRTVRTKAQIQEAYRRTWQRVEAFLSDEQRLKVEYDDEHGSVSGHWIAYHLLEHDIHHRADLFHYLAMLGIETPEVGTPP